MMQLRGEFHQHLPPALTDTGDARGEPDPALRDSMLLITILGAFPEATPRNRGPSCRLWWWGSAASPR
jgi:hypothetical protein